MAQRRELAHLLEQGRDASARIRVENVITTDVGVEAMEMVELYCELLLARANVLDQLAYGEKGAELRRRLASGRGASPSHHSSTSTGGKQATKGLFGFSWFSGSSHQDQGQGKKVEQEGTETAHGGKEGHEHEHDTSNIDPETEQPYYFDPAIDEAAVSVLYAWSRFPHDVRELTILRTLLGERYGKEFMLLATDNKADVKVPERLVKGLRVRAPSGELVENYLREIAKAYGVEWPSLGETDDIGSAPVETGLDYADGSTATNDQHTDHDNDNGGGDNGTEAPWTPPKKQHQSELSKATPPAGLGEGKKNIISVSPPAARTDNLNPQLKLPEQGSDNTAATQVPSRNDSSSGKNNSNNNQDNPNRIPEVDELTRRFAALRRRG